MNLAYVRVSTREQNESRQMVSLERFGIEKWFIEKVSASTADRPKLQEMLEFARSGDTIYVHDFSRLARNTADLLRIIEQLSAKEVTLISATEKFDTSSATGKLMLTMLAAINEFERNILLERQREGIEQARLRGVYHGRPKIPIPDNFGYILEKLEDRTLTKTKAAELLGVSRITLRNMMAEYSDPSYSKSADFPDGFDKLYSEYLEGNITIPDIVIALSKTRREVDLLMRRYTAFLKKKNDDNEAEPEPLPEAES